MAFTKAVRKGVHVFGALSGGTGSGKTMSLLRLAAGLSGGKRFAFIDTEEGRGLHYADRFDYDHDTLRPPFRPKAYEDKIDEAIAAGYETIVIDSGSHEHAGPGGLMDWHDELLEEKIERARANAARYNDKNFDEAKQREKLSISCWIEPKKGHSRMVQRLLQAPAHILMGFRAAEKIEFAKVPFEKDGKTLYKTELRPMERETGVDGWVPICEKMLPFEATFSYLMLSKNPGVPIAIKHPEWAHKMFPLDKQITEESGRALADWCAGVKPATADDVLRVFDAAKDLEALKAAWDLTRGLPRDDIAKITTFYKAKQKELRGK